MTRTTDRRPLTSHSATIRAVSLGLTLAATSTSACGVDEHLHDTKTEAQGGVIFRPPPLDSGGSTAANGGTGPSGAGGVTGGSPGVTGGSPGTSGAPGVTSGTGGASFGGAPGGVAGASGGSPPVGSAGMPSAGSGNLGGRSGITVDINGTMLPKEDVIAFVHVGHSNMLGYGRSPSSASAYHFSEVNLRAWQYRNGTWSPALERTAGTGRNLAGPGTALVKQAVDLAPSRYFVSLGYGVGSAYCSQFLRGGLYYDEYMAAPKALKGKVTFGAIVIMLGITERHGTAQDIANFPTCINEVVTAIRTDLGEPTLPVLLCDYEMGATGSELSPTGAFGQQIIPRIREVPNVVSNAAVVPTDGLGMQDDHHFNLDGQKEWGRRVLETMKEKGWFRW